MSGGGRRTGRHHVTDGELLRLSTPQGRAALAAVVLGSGAAFLESSVVSVALPTIGEDLDLDLGGLQWILNGYLLTLSAFIILGGSLGDRLGRRRVFVLGLLGFAIASVGCALAPSGTLLIVARVLQGLAGALLVPASLAIVEASFVPEDRGRAIGAWSGWSGISSAIGPFVGGALVDAGSWRLVFFIVVIVAGAAAALALRSLPESRDPAAARNPLDWRGAALVSLGLGGVVFALVEGARAGLSTLELALGVGGVACLLGFLAVERRVPGPMLPLGVFRSRQFSGANAATLANYFALGGAFFFLSLQLQSTLGYGALAAGASLFPSTLVMLLVSPQAGRIAQRIGPRLPMTVGPLVTAVGLAWLGQIDRGSSYLTGVLPPVLVFGLGLSIFVAPLTAAVLSALPDEQAGVGSAVNNAAARTAQLLATAVLPLAAGLAAGAEAGGREFSAGFERAMWISAGVSVVGGLIAFLTVRRGAERAPIVPHPNHAHGCAPSVRRAARASVPSAARAGASAAG